MFRPLILSLLVLLLVPGPIHADQMSRIVLIQTASDRPGSGQTDFNSSLASALANYLDYYFFRTGRQVQLVSVPPGGGEHYIDSLLAGSSNVSLTHVVVRGEFEDRLSSYTDHRRVSRFIVRPNCLRLEVEFTVYEKADGQYLPAEHGHLTERDRHYWLEFESGQQARRLDSLLAVTAEPHEYLIRRMIERLFPPPHEYGLQEIAGNENIPAIALVDSSFVDEIGVDWRSEVSALLSSASYFLDREFGYSLNLARIVADNGGIASGVGPQERFRLFQRHTPEAGDTLVVGLYSSNRVEDFFGPRETDAIGLSVTGDRRLLLRQLPVGKSDDPIWRGHINSLVLVHELGHVMGAIHVSDPGSIMCHNATWLAPTQFDDFNREMVAAALKGDFTPDRAGEYIKFVSNLLERSSYNLVDYPPVIHRFMVEQNLRADPKMAMKIIGDKSLMAAAKGFGELIEGRRTEAAGLFARAYRDKSNHACLPYYLAQTTSGFASIQALRRAADLGYWHAQLLLSRLNTRRVDR